LHGIHHATLGIPIIPADCTSDRLLFNAVQRGGNRKGDMEMECLPREL
jgi:hypothetical protein